jgi:hypothetical protein
MKLNEQIEEEIVYGAAQQIIEACCPDKQEEFCEMWNTMDKKLVSSVIKIKETVNFLYNVVILGV